jgi:hypothetical protein
MRAQAEKLADVTVPDVNVALERLDAGADLGVRQPAVLDREVARHVGRASDRVVRCADELEGENLRGPIAHETAGAVARDDPRALGTAPERRARLE